jgi:ankyrin repeat protein
MKKFAFVLPIIVLWAGLLWPDIVVAFDQELFDAQKKLEELGYDPGKPDGIRGKKTINAIKLFQEEIGVSATGRLDPRTKDKLTNYREPTQFSLNEAIRLNDIVLVKALIDAGADVNEKDVAGEAPLHIAVIEGYRDIASLLIEKGAEVNIGDARGLTPLHAAAWRGYRDAVVLLIASGADIDARENRDAVTPLHTAALAGRTETAALLLERGADVNAKNTKALTPLHAAAMAGDKEMVALLIANGADINARSEDGWTPLHLASQKQHPEVVELLKSR